MIKKRKVVLIITTITFILFALVGMTFAWFYLNESTTMDFGSDITCETGKSLEISTDGQSWQGAIAMEGFSSKTVDISGDGVNLYVPITLTKDNQPVGYRAAKAIDEKGTGEFIEIELFFRSATKMNVYLSGDSYISPVDPDKTGNIYGNFSRDYIAGATRLAVLDSDGTQVEMVWAPNPNYQLEKNNGVFAFKPDGNQEAAYSYCDGTDIINYHRRDFANKKFVSGSTEATTTNSGKSAVLFQLDPPSEGEYDIRSIKLRIWFEGTDREASEALAGGVVKTKLKFTGITKSEPDPQKVTDLANITLSEGMWPGGVKTGMSFSTDGLNWTVYTGAGIPTISPGSFLFFKYPETESSFETPVKEIAIPLG